MTDPITVEICVDSVESALAAENGGAHRIELCSDLLEGGITPSAGLIATVRERVSIAMHVIIRPRGGEFCYSAHEFGVVKREVEMTKQLGANGIVVGILKEDGMVDIERVREIIDLARPLTVTFHRAFDVSADLDKALEDVIATGADRLLTSGGEQTAETGIPAITRLARAAGDRLKIMAGSGISERNVARIIAETGVREVHASLRSQVPSPKKSKRDTLLMGQFGGDKFVRELVLEERVRAFVEAANSTR
jgi:copper homeostasis protein